MGKQKIRINMNNIDSMFFSSKSANQDFEMMKTFLDKVSKDIKVEITFYSAKLITQNYLDTLQKLLDNQYADRFEYKIVVDPSIPIAK